MELDFQTGVAFGILGVVLVYLAKRFVINPIQQSKAKNNHDCGPDCSCS